MSNIIVVQSLPLLSANAATNGIVFLPWHISTAQAKKGAEKKKGILVFSDRVVS